MANAPPSPAVAAVGLHMQHLISGGRDTNMWWGTEANCLVKLWPSVANGSPLWFGNRSHTASPGTGRLPGAGSNVPEAMSEKPLQTQR